MQSSGEPACWLMDSLIEPELLAQDTSESFPVLLAIPAKLPELPPAYRDPNGVTLKMEM